MSAAPGPTAHGASPSSMQASLIPVPPKQVTNRTFSPLSSRFQLKVSERSEYVDVLSGVLPSPELTEERSVRLIGPSTPSQNITETSTPKGPLSEARRRRIHGSYPTSWAIFFFPSAIRLCFVDVPRSVVDRTRVFLYPYLLAEQ